MHRIDQPTAVGSLPTPAAAGTPGYFSNATPGSGTPTVVDNDWCNAIQEELMAILAAASVAPVKTTQNQVLTALEALFLPLSYVIPIIGVKSKNLKGVWASNSTATWTADQIIVTTSGNVPALLTSYNETLNTATSGAGGLDTGSTTTDAWYYIYAIWNGTTQNILMSLSSTAPTLPSGYTYFSRIGSIWLDGSKNIQGFIQHGSSITWAVGKNLSGLLLIAGGTSGNVTTPTWTAFAVANFVPSTATKIGLMLSTTVNSTAAAAMAAPNNSYGAWTSTSNPPPLVAEASSVNLTVNQMGTFNLESTNIYYASSAATSGLYATGYEENI